MGYQRFLILLGLLFVTGAGQVVAIGTTDDVAVATRLPVTPAVDNLINDYLQALWRHDEEAVLETFHPESRICLEESQQAKALIIYSQFEDHNEEQYRKKYRIIKFSKMASDHVEAFYDFIDTTDVELIDVVESTHQVLFNENAFASAADSGDKVLSQLNLVKIDVEKFYIEMPCVKDKSYDDDLPAVTVLDPEDEKLKILADSLELHQLEDFSELLKAGNDSDARLLVNIYLELENEDNEEKIDRLLIFIKDRLLNPVE